MVGSVPVNARSIMSLFMDISNGLILSPILQEVSLEQYLNLAFHLELEYVAFLISN